MFAYLLVNRMGCRTLEDLESVSEAQVAERSSHHRRLIIPLVMGRRLKKLTKAARVSCGRKQKGTVEDEETQVRQW